MKQWDAVFKFRATVDLIGTTQSQSCEWLDCLHTQAPSVQRCFFFCFFFFSIWKALSQPPRWNILQVEARSDEPLGKSQTVVTQRQSQPHSKFPLICFAVWNHGAETGSSAAQQSLANYMLHCRLTVRLLRDRKQLSPAGMRQIN